MSAHETLAAVVIFAFVFLASLAVLTIESALIGTAISVGVFVWAYTRLYREP